MQIFYGRYTDVPIAPWGSWSYLDRQEVAWYEQGSPLQQHPLRPPSHLEAPEHPEVLEIPLSAALETVIGVGCVGCGGKSILLFFSLWVCSFLFRRWSNHVMEKISIRVHNSKSTHFLHLNRMLATLTLNTQKKKKRNGVFVLPICIFFICLFPNEVWFIFSSRVLHLQST